MGIGAVKAVFLDRDGVLNLPVVRDGKPYPPASAAEVQIYSDAASALLALQQAGYRLIVVTNQPDIAHGTQTRQEVDAINAAIGEALPIGEFFVCPHNDRDECACRKPKPGLVLQAAQRHDIDLAQSFLIGDRWRDIDCGANAGVRTVLLDRAYQERPPDHTPDFVTDSLTTAAAWVLNR
jgi:D-glycero-D-manno-heptose 1,7-bisphosphate phosphatase